MHVELSSVHSANIEILNKILLSEWAAFHREQAATIGLARPIEPSIVVPDLETIHAVESSKGERATPTEPKKKADWESISASIKEAELYSMCDREHSRGVTNVNYLAFYKGDFPIYSDIPPDVPIYTGKAGHFYKRWGEHQKSISLVETFAKVHGIKNIALNEFYLKWVSPDRFGLTLQEMESLIVNNHQPYWNKKLRGFGNKSGQGRLTAWDRTHPGRHSVFKVVDNIVPMHGASTKK